jgi:serine/threonine-protein kinase
MSADGGKSTDGVESEGDALLRAVARAPDRPLEPPDPERLAHFRVVGRLGRGGMGVVYRAEDEKLRRAVALKALPDTSRDDERRQRFLREARSAAAVAHPNVAVVYEVDEADGRVYIAMELVEGENLRTRLDRGRLDTASAMDIARQIGRGLAAAHEKGIVHRDLKPENVMLTPGGVVKLLDFGLAKVAAAKPALGTTDAALAKTETLVTSDEGRVMGTPDYMSPEQAFGEPVDVRSDVFSFGIVAYEMLAGSRPFDGRTTGALLRAIATEPAPPLRNRAPDVDEATAAVVMRCLAKKPEERFATAGEVVVALEQTHMAVATTMTDLLPVARTGRPRRSSRAMGVVALLLFAAALAGAFVFARRGTPAGPAPATSVPAPVAGASMPVRCNAEATRLLAEGIETWETRATNEAADVFERAVQADADCAPAFLRLALWPGGRSASSVRMYFASARAHRDRLTDAESALLDVIGPTSAEPRDAAAVVDDLRSLALRFPDDAWLQVLYAVAAQNQGKAAEAEAANERALALNPRFGPAYAFLAEAARSEEDRRRYLQRCARAVPRHVMCDSLQAAPLQHGFDCPAFDRFAHDVATRNPGRQAWGIVLRALATKEPSNEALEEALRQLAGVAGPDFRTSSLNVAALTGDYSGLERLLRADPRASDADLDARAGWAAELARVLDDTGREREADELVRQVVRAAPALVVPAYPDSLVSFYARAIDAHALSRAEVIALLGPRSPTSDPSDRWDDWVVRQMLLARSSDDARRALATMPDRPAASGLLPASAYGDPSDGVLDYEIARVRALAEDFAGARRDVQSALARCDVLDWAELRPRALFLLGDMSERTGDLAGARTAYETVVKKWGQLRPKAVLADRARARLGVLAKR